MSIGKDGLSFLSSWYWDRTKSLAPALPAEVWQSWILSSCRFLERACRQDMLLNGEENNRGLGGEKEGDREMEATVGEVLRG